MTAFERETKMPVLEYNGSYYPTAYVKIKNLMSLEKMVPKEGDIFLTSYVRSGSMWTQAVIWSILNGGKPLPERLQVDFPHLEALDCSFLEDMPSPRTLKIHMPSRSLPKSSSAKYICIVRNIYDCCLSVYDYLSKNVQKFEGECYVSLDRHVEFFIDGLLPHGSYFDICQSWYELRDEPNVLFLTYEDQKKDIKSGIMKIAKFLGSNYYDQLTSCPEMVQQIIHNTEINSMKTSKSYTFPVKGFSEDLQKETKDDKLETVPLNEANAVAPKDLIFKGEVGRALTGLTEQHREKLRDSLEKKIQYKELKDILGNIF